MPEKIKRIEELKHVLSTFRGAYIPASMRDTMLALEIELIDLEGEINA